MSEYSSVLFEYYSDIRLFHAWRAKGRVGSKRAWKLPLNPCFADFLTVYQLEKTTFIPAWHSRHQNIAIWRLNLIINDVNRSRPVVTEKTEAVSAILFEDHVIVYNT